MTLVKGIAWLGFLLLVTSCGREKVTETATARALGRTAIAFPTAVTGEQVIVVTGDPLSGGYVRTATSEPLTAFLNIRRFTIRAICGGEEGVICASYYEKGTMLTFFAEPFPGFVFKGWSVVGANAQAANSQFDLTVNGPLQVIAIFERTLLGTVAEALQKVGQSLGGGLP